MHIPNFEWTNDVLWNEFKKFHKSMVYEKFIFFDDGGFYIRNGEIKPYYRRHYTDFNIRIFRANDPSAPKNLVTADNRKVTRKSLRNEEFLWDLDTDKVYSLSGLSGRYATEYGPHKTDLAPKYVQDKGWWFKFYRHADGRIVAAPVVMNVPKTFTVEETIKLETIKRACKAWDVMTQPVFSDWQLGPCDYKFALSADAFTSLTDNMKACISRHGYSIPNENKTTAYLMVKNNT